MPNFMIADKAKEAAAIYAAQMVENGMLIGLGSGSTASYFIEYLVRRCERGLKIQAVATSLKSQALATQGGIPIIDINEVSKLDFAIDGADEVDPKKNMIKGGGGALLREKIVASMANEMVVIIDDRKCVDVLGSFPLPVEIVPFGFRGTIEKMLRHNFHPKLRQDQKGETYITDNGNYIVDLHFEKIHHPEEINHTLHAIPGVVETGLFVKMAGRVVIGHSDGTVSIR